MRNTSTIDLTAGPTRATYQIYASPDVLEELRLKGIKFYRLNPDTADLRHIIAVNEAKRLFAAYNVTYYGRPI